MLTFIFFFFHDTLTTELYTLSLHDALPISIRFEVVMRPQEQRLALDAVRVGGGDLERRQRPHPVQQVEGGIGSEHALVGLARSEEHTSELQSRQYLVCRLLLEKKKKKKKNK